MIKSSRIKKTKSIKQSIDIEIPGEDELNEPPDSFLSYVSIIYGESGIGKTSLLAQFPQSVTLMLEPKRRGLRMRMVEIPYVPMKKMKSNEPTAWERIRAFIDACIEDDTVQTICVDNVDRCYELCSNHFCYAGGIKHPNDAKDYGATWSLIREEFAEAFDRVIYSEKGLVFSSKYDYKEVEVRDGDNYERLQPSAQKQCMKYLMDCTDFGIYYGYSHGQRTFTIRSANDVWTKIGPEDRFLDPNGDPINVLLAGESSAEAFQSLIDGFNNERTDFERDREATEVSKPKKKKVRTNG